MTYEGALYWHTHNGATTEQEKESEILIKEALEKQIQKKPILNTIFPSGIKWWYCPICRQNNIKTNEGFCHNCGQKLSWESDVK